MFILLIVLVFTTNQTSAYNVILKQGNSGSNVKLLQQFLNKELSLKIPTTGYFGPITKNAVNLFQTKYASDILIPQGLSKATGLWAGGSIKKAKSIDLLTLPGNTNNSNNTNNQSDTKMYKHPVFGYIPMVQTSAPSHTSTVSAVQASVAPTNLTLPVVFGTSTVGSTLTASNGSWLGSGDIGYSYQWLRSGANILNATTSTYVINNLDFNFPITVRVTATNSVGSSSATSTGINNGTYSFLPVPRIAFVGDSITTYIGAGSEYGATGFASQARVQTGSLFDFYINPNTGGNYFAQSGTKTDVHLSTFMPQALAAGAKVIVYHGGTNDSLAFTPRVSTTTASANIEAMINLAINNGAVMILTPVLGPSPSPVTASTTERVAYDAELNTAIQGLATKYNMPFVDWRVLTEVSPGRSTTGILSGDNLHPNQYGAWQMGSVLADTLMSYIKPDYLNDFWAGIDAGTYGDFVTSNPNYKFNTLTGTSTPTGYSVDVSSWVGSTTIKSIIPRTDGVSGNWWQIEAMNATPGSGKIYFKDTITRRTSSFASSSATSTITLGSIAVASADFYKDHRIWIIAGTGAGQTRKITAYSGSRVATVDVPWVTLPDTTSKYIVGFKDGERVQFFAEMQFDANTDIRGLGGYYRTVDQFAAVMSGDLSGGGEISEPYRLKNPNGTIVLRGPVTTVSNYYSGGTNFYSQLQFYFGGSGILRLGRIGVVGLDRLPGQLTFTP